jgi:hypothetical protein
VKAVMKSELLRTSGARQMLDLRQEIDHTLTEAPADDGTSSVRRRD